MNHSIVDIIKEQKDEMKFLKLTFNFCSFYYVHWFKDS